MTKYAKIKYKLEKNPSLGIIYLGFNQYHAGVIRSDLTDRSQEKTTLITI